MLQTDRNRVQTARDAVQTSRDFNKTGRDASLTETVIVLEMTGLAADGAVDTVVNRH